MRDPDETPGSLLLLDSVPAITANQGKQTADGRYLSHCNSDTQIKTYIVLNTQIILDQTEKCRREDDTKAANTNS